MARVENVVVQHRAHRRKLAVALVATGTKAA
jgi:hypothetical protein